MCLDCTSPLIYRFTSTLNTTLLRDSVVESADVELWIQKNDCKVSHGFLTGSGGSMPLNSTFSKGQLLNESIEHLKSRKKVNQIRTRIGEMSGSH